MNNPLLTLVIPVFNREALLPRTLATVEAQTCRNFRVVLVDNGSTDNSLAVCRRFAERLNATAGPAVEVLTESQPGAAAARNRGLKACTTPYVYFFDSDDDLSPDFVRKMLPFLQSGSLELIAFPVRMQVDGRTTVRAFAPKSDPALHVLNSMLSTQSMLFRTDFLRQIEGWNEALRTWDDWELGLRTLLARPRVMWAMQEPFHLIRVHDDSLTGPTFSSRAESELLAMHAATDAVRALPDEDTRKARTLCALCYRYAILWGNLRKEGDAVAAEACREAMVKNCSPTWRQRLAFHLLASYTAFGGRGAWRLALKLLVKAHAAKSPRTAVPL